MRNRYVVLNSTIINSTGFPALCQSKTGVSVSGIQIQTANFYCIAEEKMLELV
jgi:hypothetical protein